MQFWRSPKQLWNCVQRSIRRQVLCKKRCSEKFCKFAGLRPATLIKKGLRHKYFPVNFVEFLRTPFPFSIEYLLWLLLRISPYSVWMWENTDQKNSKYEHFSRSVGYVANVSVFVDITIVALLLSCKRQSMRTRIEMKSKYTRLSRLLSTCTHIV